MRYQSNIDSSAGKATLSIARPRFVVDIACDASKGGEDFTSLNVRTCSPPQLQRMCTVKLVVSESSSEPNNSSPHFGNKKNGGRPRLCQRSGRIADEKPQRVGGPRNKRATRNASGNSQNLLKHGCGWQIGVSISRNGRRYSSAARKRARNDAISDRPN